jgi:hypothetical protein
MRRVRAFDDLSNNVLPIVKRVEVTVNRCADQEARQRADDPCFVGLAPRRGMRQV